MLPCRAVPGTASCIRGERCVRGYQASGVAANPCCTQARGCLPEAAHLEPDRGEQAALHRGEELDVAVAGDAQQRAAVGQEAQVLRGRARGGAQRGLHAGPADEHDAPVAGAHLQVRRRIRARRLGDLGRPLPLKLKLKSLQQVASQMRFQV